MKTLFIGLCCALAIGAYGQTIINKSYPATAGQQIQLKFDYPVIHISTWDKNEVAVTAKVRINDDENDGAFELQQEIADGTMIIRDRIKDMDNIPRRYTIVSNGVKTVYKSKEEFREAEKHGNVQQSYEGTDMDIRLEIKVPVDAHIDIKSVYGIVELAGFNAPVTIDATYGGIDATLSTEHTGKIQATTSYGQIYSNLDLKLTDHTERDFFNSITAEPGQGPAYQFTSTYGKIYLRKP